MEVIDLTASSPPTAASASTKIMAARRVHPNAAGKVIDSSDHESEEDESEDEDEPLEITVPTLEHLAKAYPDRIELYKHLVTLPQPLLSTMLMGYLPEEPSGKPKSKSRSKARPKEQPKTGEPNTLAHCVYCHEIYDKRNNDRGCAIEHWGEFEDEEFTCCGLYVYYEAGNLAHAPPEEEEPFCYVGPHHDRLVEYDGKKETGWWKYWEDSGNTCDEMDCKGELRRFAGIRKPVSDKTRK